MLLLNYVSKMNDKRKNTKEGPSTQIIAPKPFMDCLYKECTMTYKGIVETRAKANSSKLVPVSERFDLKFNGIIFLQPIRRICNLSRAIISHAKNASHVDSITVSLKSDENSHAFSHKQILKQVVLS